MPGAILPLQIFEPRYRAMVTDAVAGNNLIAMALLRPGFEAHYYTNLAKIHQVVCIGRIREHVKIPDGRHFINLLGLCPAHVKYENSDGEYRTAYLEAVVRSCGGIDTDGEFAAREVIRQIIASSVFEDVDGVQKCRQIVDNGASLDQVVDCLAGKLLPCDALEVKQGLLEELDTLRRAETLAKELRTLQRSLEFREKSRSGWPRIGSMN
jgi:Lon protease-like protein